MNKLFCSWLLLTSLLLAAGTVQADDTCVFGATGDDVPSVVVILLDNGANMQHIAWHDAYDNSIDYTPAGGGLFTNSHGYALEISGNNYVLNPIQADLSISNAGGIQASVSKKPTFEINSRKVTLPAVPSSSPDADNVKDNAGTFRYSTNYLNWIFYSAGWTTAGEPGEDVIEPYGQADVSSLPSRSRFYYAKKAIFTLSRMANNRALFALYSFTSNSNGASNVQPIKEVAQEPLAADPADNSLDSAWVNNINNQGTVTYSPLAEGMASVGAYLSSSNAGLKDLPACTKLFTIVITPGLSSEDGSPGNQDVPGVLGDLDGDGAAGGIGEGWIKWGTEAGGYNLAQIPVGLNGTTQLDDAAHYLYENQIGDPYGQNVMTYTVGFMGDEVSRRFLINTSNNGNGITNVYDTSNPDYGKYHFDATSPDGLAAALLEALNSILERTNAFSAPVVPVTRTTSGDRLYMSFFTPKNSTNFWTGNVMKLGLNGDNNIVDANGNLATHPNGAMKEDLVPYWQTLDWADVNQPNGISHAGRKIYTYTGTNQDLTTGTNEFKDTNAAITAERLGMPVLPTASLINYIRGADTQDEDDDGNTGENRAVITGDVLHSEPVVHEYLYTVGGLTLDNVSGAFQAGETIRGNKGGWALVKTTGSPLQYQGQKSPFEVGEVITGQTSTATATITAVPNRTMIFFGANDGMLHAVNDSNGTEAWGFIPPDQLNRLKDILEAAGHQYFVDASPRIFLKDFNGDGFLTDVDGDGTWTAFDDQLILICGQRKGGNSYFALDITVPDAPKYLWRLTGTDGPAFDNRRIHQPLLGETWSHPNLGWVKTAADDEVGTPIMLIGAGYDPTHASGDAILAVNVLTGATVKTFSHASMYSIASTVAAIDYDDSGFIDVVYVGDTGGRLWRLGRFTEENGDQKTFPENNENIHDWETVMLFDAGCHEGDLLACGNGADDNLNGEADERRSFFYPPSVVLDLGYDLVYTATGSREEPCEQIADDRILAIKDDHTTPALPLTFTNLVDAAMTTPQLDGGDPGWQRDLAQGEKVLAEMLVFYGVLYFTTFTPNSDACVPGGLAKLYALNYKTGDAAMDFDLNGTNEISVQIGGGIPSKPVLILNENGTGMFVSVGSTNPAPDTPTDPGIVETDTNSWNTNFFYVWWKENFE